MIFTFVSVGQEHEMLEFGLFKCMRPFVSGFHIHLTGLSCYNGAN